MSTFASTTALTPGRNPGGMVDYRGAAALVPAIGSSSGQNPVLPPATPTPVGAPVSPNPYGPVPVFGANGPGPVSLTGGTGAPTSFDTSKQGAMGSFFSGMTQSGLNDMFHELNKTYGEGTASLIMNFLMSGAGFNQNAINNLFAAMQPQISRGTQSLMEEFSTSGNRFSSGAQLGLADYLSQVNLNQGQLESQMYEQSVGNFMNTLLDVAGGNTKRIASSPSTWDQIASAIPMIGGAAGAASAGGVGGTAGTILDIIAGMA